VLQPDIRHGFDALARLARGTLGPLARAVAVENNSRAGVPELLDDAGQLARRVVQLEDPVDDAGAMLLRHALWRMRELRGDGAATTAVIAQTLNREASRAIAAGAHPAILRDALAVCRDEALALLRAMSSPIGGGAEGRETLRAVAAAMCRDAPLRDALTTAVDIVGADGMIKIVPNDARDIVSEFVEGAMWDSGWQSPAYANEASKKRARLEDAALVVLSGALTSAEAALGGLKRLVDAGQTRLLIVSDTCADVIAQLFVQARARGVADIVAVRAPFIDAEAVQALQDIAVLSGATVLNAGQTASADDVFATIDPAHLGHARRVWAMEDRFGIVAGAREPQALRAAIALLKRQIAVESDTDHLAKHRARLGRLYGGMALVRVGAVSASHGNARRDEANRVARALQNALSQGVVAGGGAALARVAAKMLAPKALVNAEPLEARWARTMMIKALRAPFVAILENAGLDATVPLSDASHAASDHVFDVISASSAHMRAAGAIDTLETLCDALQIAVSTAIMTFTTDALVLRKSPAVSPNP
jgi:chaperonin GroEL